MVTLSTGKSMVSYLSIKLANPGSGVGGRGSMPILFMEAATSPVISTGALAILEVMEPLVVPNNKFPPNNL